MERENLDAIIDAMNGTSIKECEITSKSAYIRIVRDVNAATARPQPAPRIETPGTTSADSEQTVITEESEAPASDVISSWVGYFYRGTKKDDKPLHKLRDKVKAGQQVGIVITMNVVHQVVSEFDGKITDFLVEDGQAVEYGQPLMRISMEQ